MTNKETEDKILEAMETLFAYTNDYQSAQYAYSYELKRDGERSDGSMAQEARREAHQAALCEAVRLTKAKLDEQKKIVSDLMAGYC